MHIKNVTEIDIANKRVLIREDLNVPIKNGKIVDDQRIVKALPSLKYLIEQNAKIIIMSHLGRPTEGQIDPELSLKPIADRLQEYLKLPIKLISDLDTELPLDEHHIILLENIRFFSGEKNNSDELAKKLASLCDVFVMDAFATAHRAQASTEGVIRFAPISCAGPLLTNELNALEAAFEKPLSPLCAIVGGAKVSTKLKVLQSLLDKVNYLIVGGGIANTFLAALKYPIGKSLYEPDLVDTATTILQLAQEKNVNIPMCQDVIVGKEISDTAISRVATLDDIKEDEMILDIGPKTCQIFNDIIYKSKTIIWNGPVGVFEATPFSAGTRAISQAIAKSGAYSLAGGGDTLAAIAKFNVGDDISYISTGGGAFLEFIEGKSLPAVKALIQHAKETL